jgi:AAA+ ATPase superfamily predicted ATPase
MFFDEAPKTSRPDLYGFRDEQHSFLQALEEDARLVTIVGLRRTGKSSLLMTGLNASDQPSLIIDARAFAQSPVISRADFFSALERSLNEFIASQTRWGSRILSALKSVKGVEVNSGPPPSLSLTWGRTREEVADLPGLFASLGKVAESQKTKFVIAFDEAQEFRRLAGYDLAKLLAHVYDYIPSVQMVLTGSQVGFLHEFLSVEDPKGPLYGRVRVEIQTPRLKREQARDFLEKGFAQIKVKPDQNLIDSALEKLDGIIGWLTFLGATARRTHKFTEETVNQTLEEAARLAASEVMHFLEIRLIAKGRYLAILARLAQRPASWSELKRSVQAEEGRSISDYVFNSLLSNLVKATLASKNADGSYAIEDPVLVHALNSGALHA